MFNNKLPTNVVPIGGDNYPSVEVIVVSIILGILTTVIIDILNKHGLIKHEET